MSKLHSPGLVTGTIVTFFIKSFRCHQPRCGFSRDSFTFQDRRTESSAVKLEASSHIRSEHPSLHRHRGPEPHRTTSAHVWLLAPWRFCDVHSQRPRRSMSCTKQHSQILLASNVKRSALKTNLHGRCSRHTCVGKTKIATWLLISHLNPSHSLTE